MAVAVRGVNEPRAVRAANAGVAANPNVQVRVARYAERPGHAPWRLNAVAVIDAAK